MDPYSAIIGGVTEAATGVMSAVPYLVQTSYDTHNRKRLEELKRMQELGALGLTEEEKQAYWNALNRAGEAVRSQLTGQSEAALQAFNTNATGHALALAKLAEEQMARTQSDAGARVQQADMERADAQLQELEDRLAYKAARERQMASAVTSILMPILGFATEAGALNMTTGKQGKQASKNQEAKNVAPIEDEELDDETRQYLDLLEGF